MSHFQEQIFDKLSQAAHKNKAQGMIAFFLIGCYPHIGGNPLHENPPIIDEIEASFDIPYMLFLIDPYYDKGYVPNYLQNYPENNGVYHCGKRRVVIYRYPLEDAEYHQILDLCNLVSYVNCASYIADFTGANRVPITDNPTIYITPSNCLADVTEIGFNPVIELRDNKIQFMNPYTIEQIYHENNKLRDEKNKYGSNILSSQLNRKIQFIGWCIKRLINRLTHSSLKILNKIENKNDKMLSVIRGNRISPIYEKNVDIMGESIHHLFYRCGGRYLEYVKEVVNRWEASDINSLKSFVEQDISAILIYILKIEHNEYELDEYVEDYLPRKGYTYKNIFDRIMKTF